ncbi:TVP38/TMEM64 family protein [Natronospirillum operosum]|uniref:TVP38/TMEM64 family membrane protein n=1 Tax=Natronospirillum operosum TaxID=2759953 RepID=A0A4Z0W250_9GAMM|nr:VTT domain-containing protein [Natronospirillum operosum]TGG90739.1 TVP38/TMEM64 family protein [Natronospirillum operosum]
MKSWLRGQGRYAALIAWASVAALALSLFLLFRHRLSADHLSLWFNDNLLVASLVYTLILSLRGLFLIPSTPLLFMGIAVFPPVWVWSLNMIGILTSSAIVYVMVRGFGFDYLVRERYAARARQLSRLMEKHGEPVIIGWSFFPAVPTDVIIYCAATLRLSLVRCLVAVGIGEGILITFYVAGGNQLMAMLGMGGVAQ